MPPLCILVVFLLNGVATLSPTRRTNPNSRVTPRLVEGDIAVPERHFPTGQELSAYLVFLLNGEASPSPPTRRTNPISRVTPRLVEGDIAVPERHLATGQELSAFLANPPDLWPGGVVYYWIEPVFNDEGVNNITQAFNQIMEAVPCIKFR